VSDQTPTPSAPQRQAEAAWAWWERQGRWKWILPALFVFVVIGAASGNGAGHYGPKDAVDGHLSKSCDLFGCTSPDAARALDVSKVWCRWNGAHVEVHAFLKNTMSASVKLSITPKYDIKNGGQHGTSFGSDLPVALAAGESQNWTGDAGSPEGVPTGTPISHCKPHLHDIDIG
jgi:hypothetical protein